MTRPPDVRVDDHSRAALERWAGEIRNHANRLVNDGMSIAHVAFIVHRCDPLKELPDGGPFVSVVVMDPRAFAESYLVVRDKVQQFGATGVVALGESKVVEQFGPVDPGPYPEGFVDTHPMAKRCVTMLMQHESGLMELWCAFHDGESLGEWTERGDDAVVPNYMIDIVTVKN